MFGDWEVGRMLKMCILVGLTLAPLHVPPVRARSLPYVLLSPSLPSCLGGGAILSGVLLLASQQNILRATRKLGTVVKELLRKLRGSFSNYEEQQEGEESRLLSSFITDTATFTST